MNIDIIYHGNCADGFTGAWCAYTHFKPFIDFRKEVIVNETTGSIQYSLTENSYNGKLTFHPGVYGKPPPDISDSGFVYLIDFSYKRGIIEKILEKAFYVIILDHHISAKNDLEGLYHKNLSMDLDLERSGAVIAWDWFHSKDTRPLLLGHIQDRDLWQFKLPNTREIQSSVFSFEYTFENWDKLMSIDVSKDAQAYVNLIVEGQAIHRKHQKDIKELLSSCVRPMVIAGVEVPTASLPYTMASDAGEIMAKDHPFAATYYDTKEHRAFSLRSTVGIGLDVSKIAEYYGGGGHTNASGFKVPRDHLLAKS